MGKITRGRLSGLDGMRRHTAAELYSLARDLDAQIADPLNQADPRWLRRWAARIRRLADQKTAARDHKQSKGRHRDPDA